MRILDACCGSRMMWFDKQHPDVVFADIRDEVVAVDGYADTVIRPSVRCDFRSLPFADGVFDHVVMDPPHTRARQAGTGIIAAKYGALFDNWETDLRAGVDEAMRVLKVGGTLNFKWSEVELPLNTIIAALYREPLYGTRPGGRHAKTVWLSFVRGARVDGS